MLVTLLATAALAQVTLGAIQTLGQGDQCLQVSGGSPANGSPVTLGACNSANGQMQSTGQQWNISPGNNAGVQLFGTNLCLDAGPDPTPGRALTVALCQQSATQAWYLTDDNRVAVTGGTQCLQSDGTTAQSQNCGPGITQQAWTPTFLFDAPTPSSSAASSASASASSASGVAGGIVGGAASSGSSAASMASSMASSAMSSGASAVSGASSAASSAASGASSAASSAASGASSAASGAVSGASSVASGAGSAAGAATSGAGSVAGAATSGAGSVAGAATSGAGSVVGGASSVAGSVAGAATSAVTGGRSAGFTTSQVSGGLMALVGVMMGAVWVL